MQSSCACTNFPGSDTTKHIMNKFLHVGDICCCRSRGYVTYDCSFFSRLSFSGCGENFHAREYANQKRMFPFITHVMFIRMCIICMFMAANTVRGNSSSYTCACALHMKKKTIQHNAIIWRHFIHGCKVESHWWAVDKALPHFSSQQTHPLILGQRCVAFIYPNCR